MPLYDYKCAKCGNVFEVKQSIKDEPLKKCPECGDKIERLISAAGIIFKGSGFYVTDSRKKTEKPQVTTPKATEKSKTETTKEKPKEKKETKKDSTLNHAPSLGSGSKG